MSCFITDNVIDDYKEGSDSNSLTYGNSYSRRRIDNNFFSTYCNFFIEYKINFIAKFVYNVINTGAYMYRIDNVYTPLVNRFCDKQLYLGISRKIDYLSNSNNTSTISIFTHIVGLTNILMLDFSDIVSSDINKGLDQFNLLLIRICNYNNSEIRYHLVNNPLLLTYNLCHKFNQVVNGILTCEVTTGDLFYGTLPLFTISYINLIGMRFGIGCEYFYIDTTYGCSILFGIRQLLPTLFYFFDEEISDKSDLFNQLFVYGFCLTMV